MSSGLPDEVADSGPAGPDGAAETPGDQHPPRTNSCGRGSSGTGLSHACGRQRCPAGKRCQNSYVT